MSTDDSLATQKLTPAANIAIWVLLSAGFVVILNETVMGVALPVLLQELNITAATGQWLTTGFLLTMSVIIPITGALMQRLTTRRLFFTAMLFFLAGTLIAACAPEFYTLLLGRITQAVGTAITMPLLMTTVVTVVPPQMRGRIMGRVSLVIAVAPALGPTVSGIILENFTWRAIFIFILPVVTIATLIAIKFLPNVGQQTRAVIDPLSVLLSVLGFGSLVYGLSALAVPGSNLQVSFVTVAAGAIGVALFVWRQLRLQPQGRALLNLSVFAYRPYRAGAGLLAVCIMAMFGLLVLLPIYTSDVLQFSTLQIGLLLLPGGLIMGLMGPLIGRLVDRYGSRKLLVPGVSVACVAVWLFAFFDVTSSYWFVQSAHLLFSVGMTCIFTPIFSAALGSLPQELAPYGSATISTLQQITGAAGIALFVLVYSFTITQAGAELTALTPAVNMQGLNAAFIGIATLLTLAVPVTLLMPGKQENP